MKKLLIISEKFWPEGGGAEFATFLISNILSHYFNVSILTGTLSSQVNDAQVLYAPWLKTENKFTLWSTIIRNRGTIEKSIKKNDIIYVPRASFPVIPWGKKLGKKIVTHLHDYIPISYNAVLLAPFEQRKHRLNRDTLMLERRKGIRYLAAARLFSSLSRNLVRDWVQFSNVIVYSSYRQRDITASQAPELCCRDNSKVIHNPLPIMPYFEKHLDKPTFLYVGGDSYIKGYPVLLKAIVELNREKCNAGFIMVGDFSNESWRIMNSLNIGLAKTYEVVGRVRHQNLLKLHSKVWGLVFPSIVEEPSPYAVVESMQMGTLPIASRVGGVPEIVEGTCAEKTLFSPGDANAIVSSIQKVFSLSKEQLLNVGMELRETALKRFNHEIIEEQLLEAFDS
jgi:glycosyltransferase involved in cell wall biosynthesis